MLQHSFVLDSLDTTGADTFEHFEHLIDEHCQLTNSAQVSRLQQVVPTMGVIHTALPLRAAFEAYNQKHQLTKRRHVQISFNELRHILNLAQIMALSRTNPSELLARNNSISDSALPPVVVVETANSDITFAGPRLVTLDGDQTLYADGANFEQNPALAQYLYALCFDHNVAVAVVTAAGYEYAVPKYQHRLSGLLEYFYTHGGEREVDFYVLGGECNYLLKYSKGTLVPVPESTPDGWWTTTAAKVPDAPIHWQADEVTAILDVAYSTAAQAVADLQLKAKLIRKKRSIGMVPTGGEIPRESLDEVVLRLQEALRLHPSTIPYCAFNGGRDVWVDVGNKRVGVQILQAYLDVSATETLHIGDQFLNTGNDYAARDVSPCVWIINPVETTYILKSMLRLAGHAPKKVDFKEVNRRAEQAQKMDVYTGELISK